MEKNFLSFILKKLKTGQVWWCKPVIPSSQETGGSWFKSSLGKS
jgi:hypothetical protein